MISETFTDGIGWIGLSEGMIRIDFVSLAPVGVGESRQPTPEIRHRLIMTPEAFLRSLVAQQGLVAKLEEAGRVKRLPEPAATEPTRETAGAGDVVVRMARQTSPATELAR